MQVDSEAETSGSRNTSVPVGGWLNRNVIGMGLTSLLSDAGHEMATAVMAGFLAVLGAPVYALGLIEGISDALSSFVKLGAGWWSDRLGHRKAITTAGYALTGGAFVLFAVAVTWPLVLVGRMVAWFGRGIRGPLRDAMLAESVAPTDRGKAFGFHRAGDTLGAIIGPLVAAGLMFWLQPYASESSSRPFRIIFFLTLVPGLGSAVAFALMVQEKRRPANHGIKFWASVRALPRNFRRFLVGVGVFGAGDFSHTLLILAATQLLTGTHGAVTAAQIAALLYALRNVLYTAASYPVGALSDRFSRLGLLVLGYVLGAVVMVGFIVAFLTSTSSIVWLGVLFALAGVFIAVEDALEGAMTDQDVAVIAVHDHHIAAVELPGKLRHASHNRNAKRGGQKRRMRGCPALHHHECQEILAVQGNHIGRREVFHDKHAGDWRAGNLPRSLLAEVGQQPAAQINNVVPPSRQVFVPEGGEALVVLFNRDGHRAFRGELLLLDPLADGGIEHGVL